MQLEWAGPQPARTLHAHSWVLARNILTSGMVWFGLVCLGSLPDDRDGLVSGRFAPRPRMQDPDARLLVGWCYVLMYKSGAV